MNISKKLKGLLAACVAAVGLTAFAAPTVTIDKVETYYQPWSTIGVSYTLGGTDATINYKVAFDVTAGGQTASVTNLVPRPAGKEGWKAINTVELFGKEVSDPQAKVKVTLIEIKEKSPGVQLWADGPFWAEVNLGESGDPDHPEYGALYKFDDADAAVKSLLGQEWRVPSQADFNTLKNSSYCTKTWNSAKNGYTFTGATEGYTDKSIFLPANKYWTPELNGGSFAWAFAVREGVTKINSEFRTSSFPVRAIR